MSENDAIGAKPELAYPADKWIYIADRPRE